MPNSEYRRQPNSFRAALVAVLGLLGWSGLAFSELISPLILPSPTAVATALVDLTKAGVLGHALAATGGRVGFALLIAILGGVPVGLLFGYAPCLYAYVETPLHALRSIPATALFPLLLIMVGVGERAIVVLAAYPSLLVILVNTVTGVRLSNARRVQQARSLGLGPVALVTEVIVYEALPSIFNGIRTAVSYSLVLVVAVEMFVGVGDHGLGRMVYNYQTTYRIPETYAAILVAGLCGIALNGVVTLSERHMLRWFPNAAISA